LRILRDHLREHLHGEATPAGLRRRLESRYARRQSAAGGWRGRRHAFGFAAVAAALLALSVLLTAFDRADTHRSSGAARTKVVFHISQSDTANAALRNLLNHLDAAPDAHVVVVAHNDGVDFLLRGARDERGNPYEATVRKLAERGVQFRICNNTLVRQRIDPGQVLPAATLVPSGIVEIGRLQSEEGYAYMRL
jgi:intracellular sulfur oxidation DsrE/DsrF family protein